MKQKTSFSIYSEFVLFIIFTKIFFICRSNNLHIRDLKGFLFLSSKSKFISPGKCFEHIYVDVRSTNMYKLGERQVGITQVAKSLEILNMYAGGHHMSNKFKFGEFSL